MGPRRSSSRCFAVAVIVVLVASCAQEPAGPGDGNTLPSAKRLAFVVQPANAVAGMAITPAMHVAAQDDSGATVATFTDTVTLALAANPGGATLAGTLRVVAAGGVATFSDVRLDRTATGYRLAAAARGLTGATSDAFAVSASTAPLLLGISSPADYQTYQRDGNGQADIPVRGTYTGIPTAIEAQFNGGGWSTIDSTPSGGGFFGALSNQSGQGTLEVRFAGDTMVKASVRYVGVGDVFLVAGQSNASGYGNNYQTYRHPTLKASVYREDGTWAELTDPTDSDDGAGSPWPLLATLLLADQGVPVAFVTAADGATGLVTPSANWSKGGPQYGGLINAVRNSGIKDARAMLWHQGERDARNGVSQTAYQTALSQMLDDIQADLGGTFADLRLVCAQIGMAAGRTAAELDPIRLAQADRWRNDADILAGPVLHDVDLSDAGGDGVHFRTDAELLTLAERWWRALRYHFYGGSEPARGPQFSSATYEANRATVVFAGGQGSLVNVTDATGWAIADGNGARAISSASGTTSSVTLTVDQALVAPVTVTFGSGNAAAGTTLHDSGTYPLPPEPFVGAPATVGEIRVHARSAGRDLDPDGYLVTLDSQLTKTVGANDSVSFQNATIGRHLVEISGVAQNCLPSDTLAAVTVSGEGLWPVTVDVLCVGPIADDVEIAFVRLGVVYGMRADGSGVVDLTGHLSKSPAWSPEGTRLAFVSYHHDTGGDIYVFRADGTGLRQLTRETGPDTEPAWSPDGTKIVFRRGGVMGATADSDLYVVDVASGDVRILARTTGVIEDAPSWSPDGTRIAFEALEGVASDIFVRTVEGGSAINLTKDESYDIVNREPSWSPDGTRLVFRRLIRGGGTGYDIWLMSSDGSGQSLLVALSGADISPAWSPDGTKILFASFGDAENRIYQIRPDGTGLTALTSGSIDGAPSWRPRPGGRTGRP